MQNHSWARALTRGASDPGQDFKDTKTSAALPTALWPTDAPPKKFSATEMIPIFVGIDG